MLKINPQDAILFTKAGNELVGMVEITNIIQAPVTYKVYDFYKFINHKSKIHSQIDLYLVDKNHIT